MTAAPFVRLTSRVTFEGPFFTHDPAKRTRQNIQEMLAALAGEMEDSVRSDIRAVSGSMKRSTGWSLDHAKGFVTSGVTGKHWLTWAVVSQYTAGMSKADAIRTKAAGATIERRWHPYRRVKSGIYRSRALLRDLAEGVS